MNAVGIDELLTNEQSTSLFEEIAFADRHAARSCLQRMATTQGVPRALSAALLPLLRALFAAADADRALVNLERFTQSVSDPVALWEYLGSNPRVIEKLVTLFAGSQFLAEILLRNPDHVERWAEHKRLAQPKSRSRYLGEARAVLSGLNSGGEEAIPLVQYDALRLFQRNELLRIGTCDLLDLFDLPTVVGQLSCLADSMVTICLELVSAQTGIASNGFVVIALGKLGGEELNYSSDVDLLFLADENAMRFQRLSTRLIEALGRVTEEGFLYRVDMRLRPWGTSGPLVISLPAYLKYLREHSRSWEKQAMLKARPIAGDLDLGHDMLHQAQPLLYESAPEIVRAAVHDMKQRTESQLRGHQNQTGGIGAQHPSQQPQ